MVPSDLLQQLGVNQPAFYSVTVSLLKVDHLDSWIHKIAHDNKLTHRQDQNYAKNVSIGSFYF